MKRNVGGWDRIFRTVVGAVFIAIGVYYRSWWGAFGAIPLLTALFARCPTYVPLGVSTRAATDTRGPSGRKPTQGKTGQA